MKLLWRILSIQLLLLIVGSIAISGMANAITFNSNKIIDDSVFNNATSMSAAQIDALLNTFSSSCISSNNGFKAVDPTGYNPTNGYIYGGFVTAGQVIYDAAQAYGINPQVLVTTLEKEQSLVTGRNNYSGYCNNGDQNKYAAAVGYGCPDSGTAYSYTGLNLYQRNGVTVADTGTTCVNSASKAGFSQQVIRAAWLLKFGEQRSEGNISWAVVKGSWNNSDDPQSCYGGPMVQGTLQRCPSGGSAYYDGYTTIDGTPVHMEDGATAALYWYTPHFSGNQSFFNIFIGWFGSTYVYVPQSCDSRVNGVACVWRLDRPGTDANFLTTDTNERDSAVNSLHYLYEEKPFYAFTSQQTGVIPVYRIRLPNEHFYTTSISERDSLLQNSQNAYEGIAFYAYPTSTSPNISYPIYRLDNATGHLFVASPSQRDYLIAQGYTNEGVAFNAPSGFISAPVATAGYINVYRMSHVGQHFYSSNLTESDNALSNGWKYEGILQQVPATPTSTPVYRLSSGAGDHIYTTSTDEETNLANKGWSYEGIGWYVDSTTPTTYRFYTNGMHFYTTSLDEAFAISNNGAHFETTAFGSNQSSNPAVYRFSGAQGHFFTTDLNEAMSIANNGWKYEGIAWYASPTATSSPVYRLINGTQHFYTVSTMEMNQLANNGWKYEGIAWYASPTATSSPIYRLLNGSQHFYTTSTGEMNQLVSNGWKYEGIAWYGM